MRVSPLLLLALTLPAAAQVAPAAPPDACARQEQDRLRATGDARAWLALGRCREDAGQPGPARTAYTRAVELDPGSAPAWFSLGVLASEDGDHARAADCWERALQVDPGHLDARYNLGQHHQLHGDARAALTHFLAYAEGRPDDLDGLKKVIQACYRLEDYARAASYRERLLALVARSADPKIRGLEEFCFDQFEAPGGRFYVYERLQKQGDLFYVYTFKLAGPDGKVVRSINLESSRGIRALGVPYILGMDEGPRHSTFSVSFAELPSYPDLKRVVLQVNAGQARPAGGSETTRP